MMVKTEQAIAIGAIAVGIPLFYLAIFPPGTKPPGGGMEDVVVTVVDATTGASIIGASVDLGGVPLQSNAQGEADFPKTPSGRYPLSVSAFGYDPVSESVTVSSTDYAFQVSLTPFVACVPPTGGCGCGNVWDAIDCKCVPAKPSSMQAQPVISFNQSWYAETNILSQTCGMWIEGACPSNPQASMCPGSNGNTIQMQVQAQVVDVNGDPVCGLPVSAALSTSLSPRFQVPINLVGGSCSISGQFSYALTTSSQLTDAHGYAMFELQVSLVNLRNEGCYSIGLGASSGSLEQDFANAVNFSAPGVPGAVSQVSMNALICGAVFF